MPIDATNRRRRSSDESNHLPYAKIAAYRAVRTAIAQELKARYEVPQDLPHEMIALLMHLNRECGFAAISRNRGGAYHAVSSLATASRPGPAAGHGLAAEPAQHQSLAWEFESGEGLGPVSVSRREPHLPEL
jgi:hypothetical protein